MIKAPSPHNDTIRRYPRTLRDAFPSNPTWGQDEAPLSDRVLMYLCAFATGFLTALLGFS
jgi:hypothetical protein